MDDFPGPYGGLGQDYTNPDYDSGKERHSAGTHRFVVITVAVMLGGLLLATALRRWVFHW